MAEHNAVFGGELSGHFYFRNNYYADSGAIAMATVLSFVAQADKPMSKLIKPVARYIQSGEINFEIEEKDEALAELVNSLRPRLGHRCRRRRPRRRDHRRLRLPRLVVQRPQVQHRAAAATQPRGQGPADAR